MSSRNLRDNPFFIIGLMAAIAYYYITRQQVDDQTIYKFKHVKFKQSDYGLYYKYCKKYYYREDAIDSYYQNCAYEQGFEDFAIMNECFENGIELNFDLVVEDITHDPKFLTNETFDKAKLEAHLKSLNLTELQYRKLRLYFLYKKYMFFFIQQLAENSVTKEDAIVYLKGKNQTRSCEYLKIEKSKIREEEPAPSEEELLAFFEKTKHKYSIADLHKFNVLKMKKLEYEKLKKEAENERDNKLDLMHMFIRENNFEWLKTKYPFLCASMDETKIEPFLEELNVENAAQNGFIKQLLQNYSNTPLNECRGPVFDKQGNLYIIHCYDIEKKELTFESVKKQVLAEWRKAQYKKYVEKKELNAKLEKVTLVADAGSLEKFLFDVNFNEIGAEKIEVDAKYVYKIKLTAIENAIEAFSSKEIEQALKELKGHVRKEALASFKRALNKKHRNRD